MGMRWICIFVHMDVLCTFVYKGARVYTIYVYMYMMYTLVHFGVLCAYVCTLGCTYTFVHTCVCVRLINNCMQTYPASHVYSDLVNQSVNIMWWKPASIACMSDACMSDACMSDACMQIAHYASYVDSLPTVYPVLHKSCFTIIIVVK